LAQISRFIQNQLLDDIDANKLPLFSNLPAPAIAKSYWKLGEDAMFRDLVLAVRCDFSKIDGKLLYFSAQRSVSE